MESISDGSVTWSGGLDSSRSPVDIDPSQYSRGCNVIIPRSLGGIKVRDGIHFQHIIFDSSVTKELYELGNIHAEGYFTDKNKYYLIVVVDGVVIKMTSLTDSSFYAESLNINDRNTPSNKSWVIRVPLGCIVTNGVDLPIYVTANSARRTIPENEELDVARMGVYVQNRLFYSNSDGDIILASDFQSPIKTSEQRISGIIGFAPPEPFDIVTAVGRQKVMIDYSEGGALIFSTRNSIYSVDVRGGRSGWADPGSRVGKVTQTVEGLSAISSYSFESFGTNLYFRSTQFGIADLRQSEIQFNRMDSVVGQSIEVSDWIERDTDWLLDKCSTKSWRSRLFTTVIPERDEDHRVFWNAFVSFHPSAVYQNQQAAPRRYESIITGVRPWFLTSVKTSFDGDRLFIHSHDEDGINRMYEMVHGTDYDINHEGKRVEIEGWIETRGYDYGERFSLKKEDKRFYSLREFSRDLNIQLFARTETLSGWVKYHDETHLVGASFEVEDDCSVTPVESRKQTRFQFNVPSPNHDELGCSSNSFMWVQDRIEFKGPFYMDSFIRVAVKKQLTSSVSVEGDRKRVSYDSRKDFTYSIVNGTKIT